VPPHSSMADFLAVDFLTYDSIHLAQDVHYTGGSILKNVDISRAVGLCCLTSVADPACLSGSEFTPSPDPKVKKEPDPGSATLIPTVVIVSAIRIHIL